MRSDNPRCCITLVCGHGTQITEALLQHFKNTLKWWFVIWSNSTTVVSVHCCITIAVVRFDDQQVVCDNATCARQKRGVCDWIRTTGALLHEHWMRNPHMCTLAIVMATCSYGIYFWQRVGNLLLPGAHPGGLFGCHDRPLCTAGIQH